jgi:hypothetical protein
MRPHGSAHGGPLRWGEAFLGKAKKSKNLAHKIRPSHPLIAQGFFSFFAVGIKKTPIPATAKKPFPPPLLKPIFKCRSKGL